MPTPLVTIAVSTYNRADSFLREALVSALAQEYDPLEIVVVDNASTDGTPELVDSLADERVRYIRNEANLGANGNFNACLDHARGQYFLLLHDDDKLDTDFVTTCMAALDQWDGAEQPGLIRTGVRVMDGNARVLSTRRNSCRNPTTTDLARAWFHGLTPMYFCNTLFHTAALRTAGGFHSKRELFVDVTAVFRIAALHPVLDVAAEKASFRRHGGNNGTAQSVEAWCEDSVYLLDLICGVATSDAEELRTLGLSYFASNNYTRAARLRDLGERVRAYWTVYRAFEYRVSPLRITAYRQFKRLERAVIGVTTQRSRRTPDDDLK